MVLRLDDISCFVANWDDKATNLGRIAERLNIGLNSLVFVDDNPAERAMVRRLLAEVAVPELPEDPSGYVPALERHRYFQALAVSAEDLQAHRVLSGRRDAAGGRRVLGGGHRRFPQVARDDRAGRADRLGLRWSGASS